LKYEIFEHTADIGIRIFGSSYEEIFNNSVESFSDLIVDTGSLEGSNVQEISIRSDSPDLLLVDLLSLVLYDFEGEGILYFKADLEYSAENVSLTGRMYGSEIPENVDYRNVIKAVTYHGLEVSPEKGYAKVVFDI